MLECWLERLIKWLRKRENRKLELHNNKEMPSYRKIWEGLQRFSL